MQEDDENNIHQINYISELRKTKYINPTMFDFTTFYKRNHGNNFKQLERFVEPFQAIIPPHILPHCALGGYARGTLRIEVDSSSILYELDQLLRTGLQQELAQAAGVNIRKVKLEVKTFEEDQPM